MRYLQILLLVAAFPCLLQAQYPSPPSQSDFTPIQAFLSSDLMEGRETGERGSNLASEYIASMMQLNGLQPFGDRLPTDHIRKEDSPGRSFYQTFGLIRYRVDTATLGLVANTAKGRAGSNWIYKIDFKVNPVAQGGQGETRLVFAGYGISSDVYDDYRGLDVTNRVIVLLEGYPGHVDTNSATSIKLGKDFGEQFATMTKKIANAESKGAVAVVVVDPTEKEKHSGVARSDPEKVKEAVNDTIMAEPEYEDRDYALPSAKELNRIPIFRLSNDASRLLCSEMKINAAEFEKRCALQLAPASASVVIPDTGITVRFSITVNREMVTVRNVLGMVRGVDTSRYILVGAHYDHLGKRKELTYNGADDNASGTAGMVALSAAWAGFPSKPACNIIFAAWTAEEKGVLGSEYFAAGSWMSDIKLSLVVNMDMISRCDKEDSLRNVISIGTLPASEDLREIARKRNDRLLQPFKLDLWDVTGHCGSDYCHFASRNIPVMTFFSGFHADYHSPRDIFGKTSPERMEKILSIVNECIGEGVRK